MTSRSWIGATVVFLVLLALAVAGCGDDPGPGGPSRVGTYPPVAISGPWAEEMRAANALIRMHCESDGRSTYVDVHTPMIGDDGMPRRELLVSDGLHLSAAGYVLWTRILNPFLQ